MPERGEATEWTLALRRKFVRLWSAFHAAGCGSGVDRRRDSHTTIDARIAVRGFCAARFLK